MRNVLIASARPRRGALLGVMLLTALTVGTSLGAMAVARRTASSLQRGLNKAATADVEVDLAAADLARSRQVAALPEVTSSTSEAFIAVRPRGSGLTGGIDVVGVLPLDGVPFHAMDRPHLFAGRVPRPDRPHEVLLSRWLAHRLRLGVGDPMTIEAYRPDQIEPLFSGAQAVIPGGPQLSATVVGIGDPIDSLGQTTGFGVIFFSPASWRQNAPKSGHQQSGLPEDLAVFRTVLRARLHGGAHDEARYLRQIKRIYGDAADTTFSRDRSDVFSDAGETIRVAALAIAFFAAAAMLVGLAVTGQAISRDLRQATAQDGEVLRSIGLVRAQIAMIVATPTVIAAGFGAIVGLALTVAGSGWRQPGITRFLDPDPGVHVDATALGAGLVLISLTLGLTIVVVSWQATHPARPPRFRGSRLTRLGGQAARGRGFASRQTSIATVGGVTGVFAVLVFGASMTHLEQTPMLWGAPWNAEIRLQADGTQLSEREAPRLLADAEIAQLSGFQVFETSIEGSTTTGLALDRMKGDLGPTVLAGRLPVAPDEIAVAAKAIPGPGPSVGDSLDVGDPHAASPMRVVGLLAVPRDISFVITPDAAPARAEVHRDAGFFVRWGNQVDAARATRRLRQHFAQVDEPQPPVPVANLRRVRAYPEALGVFLALLGLASVAHLCLTGVRRGRRDLSIVLALGYTRRQVRSVVLWQTARTVGMALLIGLPAGAVVGRLSWTAVSSSVQVVNSVRLPVEEVGVILIAFMTSAVLVAVGPAWRAARLRPAETLRAG